MKLFLFLLYALGFSYALFGIIDSLQKKQRALESLFWAAAAALVNTTLLATAMAMLGIYRFWLLLAVQYGEVLVIALIAARKKVLYVPKAFFLRLKSYHFRVLPAIILAVAFALYALFPANFMMSGRDQGIYIIHGIHISESGKYAYDSDEFLNENYHDHWRVIQLGFPAFHANYQRTQTVPEYTEYLFGEAFEDADYGDMTLQFMPAFPALLAVGYDIGGLSVLFRVNAVLAVFSLLALYYFARRFFGKKTACIALLFLALCPAQIWTARITLTEILAQFLFFTASYLFAAGWEEERKTASLLGGILLGFSALARIDTYIYGLGLLFVAAYLAIWNRRKFSYLLPGVYAYSALAVFSCLWGLIYVRGYLVDLFHSGSLKMISLATVALWIIVAFCAVFGYFLNRKTKRKDWMSAIFAHRWGAICIAGAFILACLYLYFVRPLPLMQVEGTFSNQSETMKQLQRIFYSRSLIEFSWYTSVTAVLFSIFGLYRFLRNKRGKVSRLLVFFALSISNLMVYLYNPSIYPDHIWVSRRWLGVCMPFVFLLAAYGIAQIKIPKIKRAGNLIARGISLLIITVFLIYQSLPFLFVKILGGVANQYESLVGDLQEDELYLTPRNEYAAYLRFTYHKNVYLFNSKKVTIPAIQNFIEEYGCLNYVGDSPYAFVDTFAFDVELVASHEISGAYLPTLIGSYPRGCEQITFPANIYRITASDDLKTAHLPLFMFPSLGKSAQSSNEVLISDGSGNALLYGPYIALDAGEYTAEITFRLPEGAEGKVAHIDYAVGQTPSSPVKLYASNFSLGDTYTLRMPVSLKEDVSDFELRVFPMPGVALEVTEISLHKTGPQS